MPANVSQTTPDPRVSVNGTTEALQAPHTGDVSGQLMRVSPEMAADLLKRRLPNRPLSKARVRVMIQDMKSGTWIFNGEPLILSDALEVVDGQHRLQSVYESGITLPFMVIVGVGTSADVIMSIDQGKAKTAADMLAMHDLKQAQLLATTARWVFRYERQSMRLQHTELRSAALPAYVAARPSLPVSLPWGRTLRALLPAGCGSMLYFLIAQRDPAAAKHYFDALQHGDGLVRDDPAHVVREKILKGKGSRDHAGTVSRAALVVLGWNALRRERPLPAGVTWKGIEDTTVPFPQVM